MPRGIPGSGPNAKNIGAKGRGKGRSSITPSEAKRRAGNHLGGPTASDGNQRSEQPAQIPAEIGSVKIEIMTIPGRGGRPMQAERFPFADLPLAVRKEDGSMEGPSFIIPKAENPDNVLAAARKRNKGKTFVSRKMGEDVRIWREA